MTPLDGLEAAAQEYVVPVNEFAVLFLDHLGFAKMVEENPEEAFRYPAFRSGVMSADHGDWIVLGMRNPVAARVLLFHRCLEAAIHEQAQKGTIKAMLFSDSAYVVMPTVQSLTSFAATLMQRFITTFVPVRMGMAMGTFHSLRFLADTTDDVGIYASQFFGTGIVRAYRAERSGRGLRIFVHNSITASDGPHVPHRQQPRIVQRHDSTNDFPFEVEYLYRPSGKPWHAMAQMPKVNESDLRMRNAVLTMRSKAPADADVQEQYARTLTALDGMREVLGRPPFDSERGGPKTQP